MGHTIWDVVWKPKADRPPNAYISTPVATTLKVWDAVNATNMVTTYPSPHTPTLCNSAFAPTSRLHPFQAWSEGDCIMISDMFLGGQVCSFLECREAFGIPGTVPLQANMALGSESRI